MAAARRLPTLGTRLQGLGRGLGAPQPHANRLSGVSARSRSTATIRTPDKEDPFAEWLADVHAEGREGDSLEHDNHDETRESMARPGLPMSPVEAMMAATSTPADEPNLSSRATKVHVAILAQSSRARAQWERLPQRRKQELIQKSSKEVKAYERDLRRFHAKQAASDDWYAHLLPKIARSTFTRVIAPSIKEAVSTSHCQNRVPQRGRELESGSS